MYKMENKFFNDLTKQIQPYFEEGGSHAFDHTQRVYNLALMIAKEEKVDLDVLKVAVLLHDIARKKQDEIEELCHAEEGAKIVEKILKKTDFPEEKHEKVLHAIKTHRHSQNINPKTREAEILQDADRLDALGAITIARMFSTGGKMHRPLYNPDIPIKEDENSSYSKTTINGFYEKILKIKPNTFKTKKAIGMASERYKFVEEFLDRFLREWDGEA